MGSYGIGLDRCIGAIVEKHHDIKGIVWPMAVAPFKVAIVIANVNDKETFKYANNLYTKLNRIGIDTILDDRKETIGIKFNDIDLIGIPIRVTVGYKLNENKVELKIRNEEDVIDIDTSKIIDEIIKKIE
jgi:prolyl-tRNA synthetase